MPSAVGVLRLLRHPEPGTLWKIEALRRNPDNDRRLPVNLNGLADSRGRTVEPFGPELIAQNDGGWTGRAKVAVDEEPSEHFFLCLLSRAAGPSLQPQTPLRRRLR